MIPPVDGTGRHTYHVRKCLSSYVVFFTQILDGGKRKGRKVTCGASGVREVKRAVGDKGNGFLNRFRRFGMGVFRDDVFRVSPQRQFFAGFGRQNLNDLFAEVIEKAESEVGFHGNGAAVLAFVFPRADGAFAVPRQFSEPELREADGISNAPDFFGVVGGQDVGGFAQTVNKFTEGRDSIRADGGKGTAGGFARHDQGLREKKNLDLCVLNH